MIFDLKIDFFTGVYVRLMSTENVDIIVINWGDHGGRRPHILCGRESSLHPCQVKKLAGAPLLLVPYF